MNDFLEKHSKANVADFVSTHTRMPDKDLNIYGGSWCIKPEELPEFWNLHYDYVSQGGDTYFTEKQLEHGGCFAIDLDFRYSYDVTTRQHTKDNITDIVILYSEKIKKYYFVEPNVPINVFIMEKPNVNRLADGSLTKDGIHIIFGLQVDYEMQQIIRKAVIKEIPNILDLPIINDWESVFDEGISKGKTNWTLYGSKKPGNEAYELKYHYQLILDGADNEFGMPELDVDDFDFKNDYAKLSVQYPNNPVFPTNFKNIPLQIKIPKPKSPTSVTQIPKDLTKLQELVKLIRLEDKKNRQAWSMVCSFIKYNGLTNDDWLEFCKDNELNLDKEKEELFNKINNYNIQIYFLQSLAKKSNPKEYKEWIKKWDIYYISINEVQDAFACACKIKETLKHTLKLCNETWYMLTDNNLWKSQKEPTFYIIKEIHKYLDAHRDNLNERASNAEGEAKSAVIKSMENWFKLYTVITKSGYLSVITKTLRPLLTDDKFEKKLDNNKGKMAFKNGIMDLESKVFRYGIEWDDYITDTIPYDYVPCNYDYLKSILLPILNNNQEHLEYYLSIIGYSFIGDAELEKALYFMIDKTEEAKGNNGKTFFFDILNDLLPNYVYKSKSTFILKSNTKAHKQLAKMKGKRLVWLEELPKDETNAVLMKEIADGKTTENEVMYGTSEDINIMFKLFVLSNNIPKIGDEEEAVYNRLKQISFNSHFDTSGLREESNIEKLEFIADKELASKIKTTCFNEVFNMIIDYASKYYSNKLPKVPSQFLNDTKDTKNKNDKFMKWFKENCIKDEYKKIALEFLIEQTKVEKDTIKSKMKSLGFKYDKDLSGMGKNVKGKAYKGGFEGVGLDDDEEE